MTSLESLFSFFPSFLVKSSRLLVVSHPLVNGTIAGKRRDTAFGVLASPGLRALVNMVFFGLPDNKKLHVSGIGMFFFGFHLIISSLTTFLGTT